MQKDSAQAKISLKVVGGLLFLTHPVYLHVSLWFFITSFIILAIFSHNGMVYILSKVTASAPLIFTLHSDTLTTYGSI